MLDAAMLWCKRRRAKVLARVRRVEADIKAQLEAVLSDPTMHAAAMCMYISVYVCVCTCMYT